MKLSLGQRQKECRTDDALLRSKISETNERLDQMELQAKALASENAGFRRTVKQASRELDVMESIARERRDNERLNKEVTELRRSNSVVTARIAAFTSEASDAKQLVQRLQSEVLTLQQQIGQTRVGTSPTRRAAVAGSGSPCAPKTPRSSASCDAGSGGTGSAFAMADSHTTNLPSRGTMQSGLKLRSTRSASRSAGNALAGGVKRSSRVAVSAGEVAPLGTTAKRGVSAAAGRGRSSTPATHTLQRPAGLPPKGLTGGSSTVCPKLQQLSSKFLNAGSPHVAKVASPCRRRNPASKPVAMPVLSPRLPVITAASGGA